MYLASEIIFEFILVYFLSFFCHFWSKHLFGFKKNYFYVYIMDTASKSLKKARNVLLSHFKSKGLTKLDFTSPQGSDMSYSTYSMQLLGSEFKNPENNTHLLSKSINEGNERGIKLFNYLLFMFMSKLNKLVPQDYKI